MKYSQYGQDTTLRGMCAKENGVFVDIGAHDGITYNNSKLFEDGGWTCICIEPLPNVFEQLRENRKKSIVENCAISNKEGEFDFVQIHGYGEMLSGFRREEVAEQTIASHGGSYEIIKVPVFRLETILGKHNINHIDICSIDVEGNELNVVKSIDFDKIVIDFMTIEASPGIEEVHQYISPWYVLNRNVGGDRIYRRK